MVSYNVLTPMDELGTHFQHASLMTLRGFAQRTQFFSLYMYLHVLNGKFKTIITVINIINE